MSKFSKFGNRILSVLVLILIVFNCTTSNSVATYDEITPYYINILKEEATIDISGLKSECSAKLYSKNSLTLLIKMELQKNKSGGYETVETWTSSKTGTYLSVSESRLINVFADYRLKVTFTAGTETSIVYDYP